MKGLCFCGLEIVGQELMRQAWSRLDRCFGFVLQAIGRSPSLPDRADDERSLIMSACNRSSSVDQYAAEANCPRCNQLDIVDHLSLIPDEVLAYVLTRLPTRDLVRSRMVRQDWNRLLQSPAFFRQLKLLGPPNYSYDHEQQPWLFVIPGSEYHNSTQISTCAYNPDLDTWHKIPLTFLPPSMFYTPIPHVISPWGGLLFFKTRSKEAEEISSAASTERLVVCNPITKTWRQLPPMIHVHRVHFAGMVDNNIASSHELDSWSSTTWEGSNFKVVAAGREFDGGGGNDPRYNWSIEVYDSLTDSWHIVTSKRQILPPPTHQYIARYHYGTLYVLAGADLNNSVTIWACDIATGKRRIVRFLPPGPVPCSFLYLRRQGGLALVQWVFTRNRSHPLSLRMWKLLKNGQVKSLDDQVAPDDDDHRQEEEQTSNNWVEIARIPAHHYQRLLHESSATSGARLSAPPYIKCAGSDDRCNIYFHHFFQRSSEILVWDSSSRDPNNSAWRWLPSCPMPLTGSDRWVELQVDTSLFV